MEREFSALPLHLRLLCRLARKVCEKELAQCRSDLKLARTGLEVVTAVWTSRPPHVITNGIAPVRRKHESREPMFKTIVLPLAIHTLSFNGTVAHVANDSASNGNDGHSEMRKEASCVTVCHAQES